MRTRRVSNIVATTIGVTAVLALAGCNKSSEDSHTKLASNESPAVPTIVVTQAVNQTLNRNIELPGELVAYQDIGIAPKVDGYISQMNVDRGSVVKTGQTLLVITAPELDAKVQEAKSKVASAHGMLLEAKSKLQSTDAMVAEAQAKEEADESTFKRIQKAARIPGVISANEVEVSGKQVEADQQRVASLKESVAAAKSQVVASQDNYKAAQNSLSSIEAMRAYLTVKAPYNGIISRRTVNLGSFVTAAENKPMLTLQELYHLRLVIPVPEIAVSGIAVGKKVAFSVPAYPGKNFEGTLARVSHALDQTTRTMPVELDVWNTTNDLAPGMFPTVHWVTERPYETVFVPSSAVGQNMEKTYVVKIHDGIAEQITVRKGQPMGDMQEVFGDIKAGDSVAVRATDDLKSGTRVAMKEASQDDIKAVLHPAKGGE